MSDNKFEGQCMRGPSIPSGLTSGPSCDNAASQPRYYDFPSAWQALEAGQRVKRLRHQGSVFLVKNGQLTYGLQDGHVGGVLLGNAIIWAPFAGGPNEIFVFCSEDMAAKDWMIL